MKCLILAGGKGERLWPLSRSNFPKQFIEVQKDHSIFQETVARNMAYCDEFIIVTNYAYRSIIANQMQAFQGVAWRCVYEEEPRKTTAALALTCLGLQPSEYVFAVAADHLVDTGECDGLDYKSAILKAKQFARDGKIVIFGAKTDQIDKRFGYFTGDGENFVEKPSETQVQELLKADRFFQNLGMMVFQNGVLLNELKKHRPQIYSQCLKAFKKRRPVDDGLLYTAQTLKSIEAVSVEHSIIEPSTKKLGIGIGFDWNDIGSLEDLSKTQLENDGVVLIRDSENSIVINQSKNQAVVLNSVDDILVVNSGDAVYVGRKGSSPKLKEILHSNSGLEPFAEQGTKVYRPWGYYERLTEDAGYRVRKIVVLPGKTIYEHRHIKRNETWALVSGDLYISFGGKSAVYKCGDSINVPAGIDHQISNIGVKEAVIIETAVGDLLNGEDVVSDSAAKVTDTELGIRPELMVKLKPAFKDYLWGGTKLRDVYGKLCDYDVVAESWELSAHPAGNSIVASGRYHGMEFSKYIASVGREILGWKCSSMQSFPLLVKFIDARQNLSVQVHPGDDYALENENEYGKNEMWYVVEADKEAGLYVGFNRDVSREEVERRIRDNSILEVLNFFPTKPGDVFFIPAGTVHAIGAGNLICEIQQSSNCTYRLYDYDRRDKFGNPRELHLEKALDVLDYKKYQPAEIDHEQQQDRKQLRCKYFETSILDLDNEASMQLERDSFYSVICINGTCCMELCDSSMEIKAGESIFIPAVTATLKIAGKAKIIVTKI